MSTTSSIMLRNASRCSYFLSRNLGREKASNIRLKYRGSSSALSRTSFSTQHRGGAISECSENDHLTDFPEPLVALAFAYDFEDSYSDEKSSDIYPGDGKIAQHTVNHDVTRFGTPIASVAGGPSGRGPSSSTPYPPPSSMTSTNGPTSLKSGGGTGRHRCPNCGTTVTFRYDSEENSFYCATCSGLFVVNPNKPGSNEESKADAPTYQEITAKTGAHCMTDPDILMRHVS